MDQPPRDPRDVLIGILRLPVGVSQVSSPPAYRTEKIKGGAFNLVSANLDSPVGATGTLDGVSGTTLSDVDVDFTAAFPLAVAWIPESLVLTMISGPGAGIMQEVTRWTAHTLETTNDISSVIAIGDEYELRRMPTIGSMRLQNWLHHPGNVDHCRHDLAARWSGRLLAILLSPGSICGVGWRQVGRGCFDASVVPVPITDGFFIQRRWGPDIVDMVFHGHVRTHPVKIVVQPGVRTLVSRVVPVAVTLNDSELENDLERGTANTADLIWNPDGHGGFAVYFYSDGGLLGRGWRQVSGGARDRGNVNLASAFMIERRAPTPGIVTLRIPRTFRSRVP